MKRIEIQYPASDEPAQIMVGDVPRAGESVTVDDVAYPVLGVVHTANPTYSEPVARLTLGEAAA